MALVKLFDDKSATLEAREVFMVKESKLDALTKEYIYLGAGITNNCEYCIHSHIAAARKKGMDDEG
jgi:AhpD family alkylhydroperoxidase